MQKWEYLRLDISHSEDQARITANFDLTRTVSVKVSELISSLDRLGDQNWEMVSLAVGQEPMTAFQIEETP